MKRLTPAITRKIRKLKRFQSYPIEHKIYKTHKISHKTLFYMKEYGNRSHIMSVILKESLLPLMIAFAVGLIGGINLQAIKGNFVAFLPLIILLPSLNDMIGDYSMIMISRLTTLIFSRRVPRNLWISQEVRDLIKTIISVAIFSALYIGLMSSIIAYLKGFMISTETTIKVLEVSLITTFLMVGLVILIAALGVFYVSRQQEDPNNLVMPIMTSVADFGTILVFAITVKLIF